jgi:hypothetical protein
MAQMCEGPVKIDAAVRAQPAATRLTGDGERDGDRAQ